MTDREVMQQALEALTYCEALNRDVEQQKTQAITALCTALEQPEQEPVAWRYRITNPAMDWVAAWSFQDSKMRPAVPTDHKWDVQPLYTTPPAAQRPWVGLTDEEILEAAQIDGADTWLFATAYAIEAKLKEKNNA